VTLNSPVWHRLTKTNAWLYFTQPDLCTIKCSDPPLTFRVEISGVGRLTVLPSCEIYTTNSIFVANSKFHRDISLEIIPVNRKFNTISMLTEIHSPLLPKNLTNVKLFNDLNFLVHEAGESSVLEHKPVETLFIFKIEFHIAIIYIFIICTVLSTVVLVIRFRTKIIKMYSPEGANNSSSEE